MIINCKKYTNTKKEELRSFIKCHGGKPTLAIIRFDNDPVTEELVQNLISDCEQIGAQAEHYRFDVTTTYNDVLSMIYYLDRRQSVYGIFIAGSIPEAFKDITQYITSSKDINALRNDSPYTNATTKGVVGAVDNCSQLIIVGNKVLVIDKGGKHSSLVQELKKLGNTVIWCDGLESDYETWPPMVDMIISANNVTDSIVPSLIYNDQFVVDLGHSKDKFGQPCGDLSSDCYGKPATFITWQGSDLLFRTALLENLIYETPYGRKGRAIV